MSALRFALLASVVLAVIGLALAWLLGTSSGARTVVSLAERALDGRFRVEQVDGTLAGPLILRGLTYRQGPNGTQFSADRVRVDLAAGALLRRELRVADAALRGVALDIRPSPQRLRRANRGYVSVPPIDLIVEDLAVDRASIRRNGKRLFELPQARLEGRWTHKVMTASGRTRFEWRTNDAVFHGMLRFRSNSERTLAHARLAEPFTAELHARVGHQAGLPWQVTLTAAPFDPRTIRARLPVSRAAADISASGDRSSARFSGRVLVEDQWIKVSEARMTRRGDRVLLEALTLRAADSPATLRASGALAMGDRGIDADLAVRWHDIELPEELLGTRLMTQGRLRIRGKPSDYRASGELALGERDKMADISLKVHGTQHQVSIEQLSVTTPDGRLLASGRLRFAPHLAWTLDAQASAFDPGAILPRWPGNLSFELATQGHRDDDGTRASFELRQLDGRLRGRTVSGSGGLVLEPHMVLEGRLRLRSGVSSIAISGRSAERTDVRARLNVRTLADWLPDARGSLTGVVRASGRWPQLSVALSIWAAGLRTRGATVRHAVMDAEITDLAQLTGWARAQATEVSLGSFHWANVSMRAHGDRESHVARVKARGAPLGGELRVRGKRLEHGWDGTLLSLSLDPQRFQTLRLQQAVPVRVTADAITIGDLCLRAREAVVCVGGTRRRDASIDARYEVRNLPLDLLRTVSGTDRFALDGMLEGDGTVRRESNGAWFGRASLQSASGDISLPQRSTRPLLAYEAARIRAELSGGQARIRATATVEQHGSLEAELALQNLTGSVPAVEGTVVLNLPQLDALALLAPQLANVDGHLEADASIAGALAEPRIAARVAIPDFAADVPRLGIRIARGELRLTRTSRGALGLSGHAASGDGRLAFRTVEADPNALRVAIEGTEFVIADLPGAHVEVSPNLVLAWNGERALLEGTVRIPQATVNLQRLPEGRRPRLSPDVIVIEDERPKESRQGLRLYANVTVILGDEVQLAGFGLDALLDGRLQVSEAPGEPATGSGEINVGGTYEAYGQHLIIERGRLLYAGTPIGNPRLDIEAYRPVEADVRVGLQVSGTARDPALAVTSDPLLPEAEALSYLVTGRALAQASAEDADLVQSAARSLGTAAGNLIAGRIGRRLGIDEVGIERTAALGGGAAFTVGEYLSPRLFLSYGVGLFTPGEVITLRYQLTDAIRLSASNAPSETRAAVTYEVER